MSGPRWRSGRPNAVGVWVIIQNGEYMAAMVTYDKTEEGEKYLRTDIEGDSWPLNEYPWGCYPSFGPIRFRKNKNPNSRDAAN